MLTSFIKKYYLLLGVVLVGLFLRIYKFRELFLYSHDQDLAGWMIKDIVFNGHLRLIGQETSTHGVFIGALFDYALIPFYFLANWDPIGGIWFSVLIGLAAIVSVYFILREIFGPKVGLIASFIYSCSFLIVLTDREVVPTTPAMLWSVWFMYSVNLILKGKQKTGFLLTAILFGLVWHINLSLLLLAPITLLAILLSKKRLNLRVTLLAVVVFLIINMPFFVFEMKHGFQQIKSITSSLVTDQNYIEGTAKGIDKLDRTMQLVHKNVTSLFYNGAVGRFPRLSFYFLVIALVYFTYKKIFSEKWTAMFLVWIALFVAFFTLNSINISEYYLNGLNIVWITIFSVIMGNLLEKSNTKSIAYALLFMFAIVNFYRFFSLPINESGYIQRKAMVNFIKEDAKSHNYPCVSVSYITTPGNNLGYRYLFYIAGVHVNQPKSGSPVYSIVYPHSMVDRIDHSFGALGLVLPDYNRYNEKSVVESCKGENANLTEPMFGYTQ